MLIGLGIFILIIIFFYNRTISMEENVDAAWAQVENQLQRRLDLVPNLVNTVKGYAEHEKEVLTAVTDARSRVGSAQTIPDKMNANKQLTSALGRLMVVMENYPNLKANQNFLALQSQLEGTENRIAVARKRYNDAAGHFNKTRKKFPTVIFASILGFEEKPYFKADEGAKKVPEVKF